MKAGHRIIRYLSLLSAVALVAGCGKRGALVYPDLNIPPAPTSLEARAVGDAVRLRMLLPTAVAPDGAPGSYATLLIYRQENPLSQPFCNSCSESIPLQSKVYLDHLKNGERQGKSLVLLDTTVQPEQRYRYRLALATRDGLRGTQSEVTEVATMGAVPAPQLSVESTPTEAIIKITAQTPLVGKPAGYTVYRWIAGEARTLVPYLQLGARENSTSDFMLKQGVKYIYGVRTLVQLESGELQESLMSNEAEGMRIKDE